MTALKVIQQNQFQNCYEGWIRRWRWHWCKASQGSTSKTTTVIFSNEVGSTFTRKGSRTLLSDNVYVTGIFYLITFVTHSYRETITQQLQFTMITSF
jgi:hypothetical protein